MKGPEKLWKTRIIIWTDYDPSGIELDSLAREAQVGDAYCSSQSTREVNTGSLPDDSDWDGTEFFGEI